jgi:hypothetical protein
MRNRNFGRCESNVSTRRVGRCNMAVVAEGERFCRYHHPAHRAATQADMRRRAAEARIRKERASGHSSPATADASRQ